MLSHVRRSDDLRIFFIVQLAYITIDCTRHVFISCFHEFLCQMASVIKMLGEQLRCRCAGRQTRDPDLYT